MSESLSSNDELFLLARVRRYLPYLGIYASDVRALVNLAENQRIELARAVEHNAALMDLANA